MVKINGKPKSANGCFARLARYLEAIELAEEEERNFLDWKTAMVVVYSGGVCGKERVEEGRLESNGAQRGRRRVVYSRLWPGDFPNQARKAAPCQAS